MSFFSSYCLLHEKFTEWVERQLSQDIKHSSDNNQALVQICQKGTIKYSLFLAPQLIYEDIRYHQVRLQSLVAYPIILVCFSSL